MKFIFKNFAALVFFFSTNVLANDIAISTGGVEGATSISRAFITKDTTKTVKVRYRFITSEVPGGFFGTEYNDFFSISIKSTNGKNAADSRSMNSLGLGAFDGAGATDWRETTLSISGGDTVDIDVSVANVGDAQFDSQVIVDFVEEVTLEITDASLRDIDNSTLEYLSGDTHTYFSGNTRVHGTITITGNKDDSLTSLDLEIVQGGSVVAIGALDNSVSSSLLTAFGEDEEIKISTSALLFNIPASNGINTSNNGTVLLRIKATNDNGDEVTKDIKSVPVLAKFSGNNRYGGRDVNRGGDDWVKPSVVTIINNFGTNTYGDMSNMHAGSFAPDHGSHRTGNDVDGWFPGYNNRDANTAQTIINQLNDPSGSNISIVFVTYQQTATNAFWNAIKNVTLTDGRLASSVIRPLGGHGSHFHWRIPN